MSLEEAIEKLTPKMRLFLAAKLQGISDSQACAVAGCNKNSPLNWKKTRGFQEIYQAIEDGPDAELYELLLDSQEKALVANTKSQFKVATLLQTLNATLGIPTGTPERAIDAGEQALRRRGRVAGLAALIMMILSDKTSDKDKINAVKGVLKDTATYQSIHFHGLPTSGYKAGLMAVETMQQEIAAEKATGFIEGAFTVKGEDDNDDS